MGLPSHGGGRFGHWGGLTWREGFTIPQGCGRLTRGQISHPPDLAIRLKRRGWRSGSSRGVGNPAHAEEYPPKLTDRYAKELQRMCVMQKKHKLLNLILAILFLGGFVMAPSAQATPPAPPPPPTTPPGRFQLLPEEVLASFQGGMSSEEFLLMTRGPIPNALADLAGQEITVVVELVDPSVAELFSNARGNMSPLAQRSHAEELASLQRPVADYVVSHSGAVISQYTKVYNGLLVNVPFEQLAELRMLPNVKAIHRAPVYYPILDNSVPTIRADKVAADLGFDGTGISIGIIDTGVDYTHAALGGNGDPADYIANNPDILDFGFPNAKVVGGYDFAGTDYEAGEVPVPDEDPLDEYTFGHGTHVASTAAGLEAGDVSKGVAPGADIYALKVYGSSGGTNLIADAIEWAMDPDGDDDLSDHLDVINISSGTTYGPADDNDPAIAAVNNAVAAGVVVVAAAGNDGDVSYITSSPASASGAISVAGSNSGYDSGPTVSTAARDFLYQPSSFDNWSGRYTVESTAPLFYTGTITDDRLCDISGFAPGATPMLGSIALIQRGDCNFDVKVDNAEALGAVGVIVFNNEPGKTGMSGHEVNIPACMVADVDGQALQASHGLAVTVSAEGDTSKTQTPEYIWDSSARGPRGFDSNLKPEITAPATPIYAANYKTGTGKTGFAGTSMASPHVAGAAALVVQAHPAWTPDQVKAALMNRAVDLADLSPVPRVGAGRVDAYESVNRSVIAVGDAELVSLSWGVLLMGGATYTDTKTVTFSNYTASEITYNIAWYFDGESSTDGVGFTHPASVTVPAVGTAQVDVQLDANPAQIPSNFNDADADPILEEYSGYFVFTNAGDAADKLRLPFYLLPRPYSQLTELSSELIMDYDADKASVELQHSGPISSKLWGYPAFMSDPNEAGIGDEGDLRLFGLDYGGLMDTNDDDIPDTDSIIAAINVYGSWHTPQTTFVKFYLFIDVDQDGTDDYKLYNYDFGYDDTKNYNDLWMVFKEDLSTGQVSLASPFAIYTDYNAGYMEWYIPTHGSYGFGLDPVGGGGDTRFDFHLSCYGYYENEDATEVYQFDVAHPPLTWGPAAGSPADPGPGDTETTYEISINDAAGYDYSQPLGFMLVDYRGQPGAGQAYYWPVTAVSPQIYLPFISRSAAGGGGGE